MYVYGRGMTWLKAKVHYTSFSISSPQHKRQVHNKSVTSLLCRVISQTPLRLVAIKLAATPSTGKLRGNVCNGFWAQLFARAKSARTLAHFIKWPLKIDNKRTFQRALFSSNSARTSAHFIFAMSMRNNYDFGHYSIGLGLQKSLYLNSRSVYRRRRRWARDSVDVPGTRCWHRRSTSRSPRSSSSSTPCTRSLTPWTEWRPMSVDTLAAGELEDVVCAASTAINCTRNIYWTSHSTVNCRTITTLLLITRLFIIGK